jgi:hypothetical protein
VAVDNWEKNSLTVGEVEKLRPFFERISTLKLQGLTGVSIVASFIRRRVQPLMLRDHFGFEYTGPEDSSRVVPKEELAESEVLRQLQKLL